MAKDPIVPFFGTAGKPRPGPSLDRRTDRTMSRGSLKPSTRLRLVLWCGLLLVMGLALSAFILVQLPARY